MRTAIVITCLNIMSLATAQTPPPRCILNINSASAQELEALPSIGPSRAQAILQMRSKKSFRSTSEILKVKGIGRATLRKLSAWLSVHESTDLNGCPFLASQKSLVP